MGLTSTQSESWLINNPSPFFELWWAIITRVVSVSKNSVKPTRRPLIGQKTGNIGPSGPSLSVGYNLSGIQNIGERSMKHWERRIVAAAVTSLALSLSACGGGGSSSGGGGASGGQTSTVVVSSSNLAVKQTEGMSRVAQVIAEFIVRNAEAQMVEVVVSGGELGEDGRVFTTNNVGVVNIPLFGGAEYEFCVGDELLQNCITLFVAQDSVVILNANTLDVEGVFPAEDDEVVGDFAIVGQENKRLICHKGRMTLAVANQAVYDAHRAHGDRAGGCEISVSTDGQESDGGQPKVTVCHDGRDLSVPESTVEPHLGHGDTLGSCGVA